MARDDEELRLLLEELQSQLAFQEDTVHTLSEAMAVQQQDILVLRRQVELLKQRQDEQSDRRSVEGNVGLLDEKPPHY